MKSIQITSEPQNIAQVETFVEALRDLYNIGDDAYGNILISLTEAANNAILHGNKTDKNKTVDISCALDDRGKLLTFIVKDQGTGFDYNNLPDPTIPENIDQPCGRGVFLMLQLADLVVFSNKGATVEMQFRL